MSDSRPDLDRLKISGNLPSMPQVLVRLIDACHRSEVDLQQVAKIINRDSTLSAKILQLVNSAFIGARSPFTDVRQAVIYLGADTVRNLAVSISVQQVFRRVEAGGQLSMDRFWYHAYENSLLARRIARKISYPDPSEAYLGGLLHDIGKLLLWMAFPGQYAPLLKGVQCHDGRLVELEREKLQVDHCEAGAWLLQQWHLPSLFADAIRFHHLPAEQLAQGLPLPRIVSLADRLSHGSPADRQCEEDAHRLLGLSPQQVAEITSGIEEQLQEVADNLGIRIPTAKAPSKQQEPDAEDRPREAPVGLISRIRDITQLTGMLDNLLRAESREQIAGAVEQSMKILFNEDTCFLLLMEEEELRGFSSPDNPLAPQVARIRFRPAEHGQSLAGEAVHGKHPVHSFMEGRRNAPTLLDTQFLHLLGTRGMAALPLIHHREVVGLIVTGIEEPQSRLLRQPAPLRLLAGQAAAGLFLCRLHEAQAERIAEERIASATMVARKIAHEINNPLAILRNYIKILEMKLKDDETVREDLAVIDQEFERIGHITSQLDDLATDRLLIRPRHLDLNQLLEETLQMYRKSLPADREIRILFEPDPALPEIETDPDCIRQILLNLLGNALDALRDGGTITVALRAMEEEDGTGAVLLTVADTGPGIPESLLPNLFDAGITTKGGGHSGLGLAIVRKITGRLGGSITCRSSEKGTIFSVSLPLRHT